MTEHDRGAYTPPTDEPLAFDARRPSERRPLPMTLIGSGLVLVLLVAGVALVYRGGVRGAGEAPRPVGSPVMSVKTAPPPAAQPQNQVADQDVYTEPKPAPAAPIAANQTGPAPIFTPAPEQPAPRPIPRPSTVAMLSHPIARATPPVAPAKPLKPAAAPATAVGGPDAGEVAAAGITTAATPKSAEKASASERAATHVAAEKAAATKLAKANAIPHATVPAAAANPATPAEAGPSGAVVQIGAFSSSALADQGYADVAGAMAGRMAGKSKHVQPLDHDGKTLYRTWVGGFATRTEAAAFCDALKAKNKICIVKVG